MLRLCILASCVASTLSMDSFIVGGHYANIEDYPHSVLALINCMESGKSVYYTCGASVINQDVLLSAAHCLFECMIKVKLGFFVGSAAVGTEPQRLSYGFTIHRHYSPKTFVNDIMLIILDAPLHLNRKIRRVALMPDPPYFETASIAGWGLVDEKLGTLPKSLKSVTQKVKTQRQCNKLFHDAMLEGTICAAADNKAGVPARGDSGSALVVRGYIQIGIVSFKVPSVSNRIVFYTDVGYFFEWIKANAKNLFCVS